MTVRDFKFDRINKHIIDELQLDARISNLDLAEKVHLSPSACLKRTKKLEEHGHIRRYTTNLNLNRLCVYVQVMAHIKLADNLQQKSAGKFELAIKNLSCAVECFKVSGEVDYIIHFICADISQYESVSEKLLRDDIGVNCIKSHFVLSTPKPFTTYPLDELLWIS